MLYGFLLYSNSDRYIVDYMSDGLIELDRISGTETAIFVIEPPTQHWLEYSETQRSLWWQLFSESAVSAASDSGESHIPDPSVVSAVIEASEFVEVELPDEEHVALRSLINPSYHGMYRRDEVWEVVQFFGLKPDKVPCLTLFYDLNDREFRLLSLKGLASQAAVRDFFRGFFSSDTFLGVLTTARERALSHA